MDVLLATARDFAELDVDDQPLVGALRDLGVDVEIAIWDDAEADWSAASMVVIRSTWDYLGRLDEFVDWAQRVEEVTTLRNPAEVVRWNTHKGYLIELEERGAPIVPTAWLGQGDRVDLGALLASRGWSDAIVKPAIGSGSRGLARVSADAPADGQRHLEELLATGDAMVQPYLRSIEDRGELSVVHIGGAFSHAVRKRPAPGDYRIQYQYGGRYEEEVPPQETLDLVAWILEATGHEYLYARVDLVEDETGQPQLAELEVTEPSLYLARVPGAADRLAAAIQARL